MAERVPKWFEDFKEALRSSAPEAARCEVEIPEDPANLGVQLASEFAKRLRSDFRVLYYEWRREGGLLRHLLVAEFGS